MFLGYNLSIMLKILALHLLLIVPHMAVISVLLPPQANSAESKEKHPGDIKSPPQNESVASPGEENTAVHNYVTNNPAPETTTQDDAWIRGGVVINGVLVLVTLGIAITSLIQALAARHSADAQMNAARAWLLASIAGQPKEPLTGNLIQEGITPGIVWGIQIFGNTPARIVRKEFRCRIVNPDPAKRSKPMLERTPEYLPDPNFTEGRTVSPPGEKQLFVVNVESEPNTRLMDRLALVPMGNAFLCSYGRVEYEDAFKRKGVTQFCAVYRPRTGGVLETPDGTAVNPPGFRIDGPDGYNYNT